jgi:hypothetical protein
MVVAPVKILAQLVVHAKLPPSKKINPATIFAYFGRLINTQKDEYLPHHLIREAADRWNTSSGLILHHFHCPWNHCLFARDRQPQKSNLEFEFQVAVKQFDF